MPKSKIIFSSIFLFLPLILMGSTCQPGDVDYEEDVFPVIEEIDGNKKVKGSCNVIASKSTCVDYIGSIWEQPDQKELNCKGVGVYSDNTCPYTNLGGCHATPGTMSAMVTWMYDYGGQALDTEDAKYAQMACDSLPVAEWTTPDELFLN